MDDTIRIPDESFRDRLIPDYEDNFMYVDDIMNEILEKSKKEYDDMLIQEQINNHRKQLFTKLDIQINYLLLQKDDYLEFFVECFKNETNKYFNNQSENISLFKSHYDYLKKLIHELYILPIERNKKPKIDNELYILINQILRYC